MYTPPTQEQTNYEILRRLQIIEDDIKKVEKKVSSIDGWFWALLIGGFLGFVLPSLFRC
jgi:hypothetical protein